MFEKLDIKNFGSFREFEWREKFKHEKFERINIIYGRNYSGKTTLSKIFRSLETGKLPEKYENIVFNIFNNGGQISQKQIDTHSVHVRVYNSDFVAENLSFLNRKDGGINTFAMVGASNNKIAEKIEEIENKIGSVERKTGLEHQLEIKNKGLKNSREKLDGEKKKHRDKMSKKASDIKKNCDKPIDYDLRHLLKDVDCVQRDSNEKLLSEDERDRKKYLLKMDRLPYIEKTSINVQFDEIAKNAILCLEKSIKPTRAIEDLLHNPELQTWVKDGQGLHKDKRESCAFCGGRLTSEVWNRLGAHFNQESKFLEEKNRTIYKRNQSRVGLYPEDVFIE